MIEVYSDLGIVVIEDDKTIHLTGFFPKPPRNLFNTRNSQVAALFFIKATHQMRGGHIGDLPRNTPFLEDFPKSIKGVGVPPCTGNNYLRSSGLCNKVKSLYALNRRPLKASLG